MTSCASNQSRCSKTSSRTLWATLTVIKNFWQGCRCSLPPGVHLLMQLSPFQCGLNIPTASKQQNIAKVMQCHFMIRCNTAMQSDTNSLE